MLTILEHVNLSSFNTMGVDAVAAYFAKFSSVNELEEGLSFAKKKEISQLVLGGGSNLLFISNYDGLVLINQIKGYEILFEDEEQVVLKVGAGENWHNLVLHCIDQGFGGIENLSLIPGTVGAAPIQNIGAYGVELKDVFESLETLNVETREIDTFKLQDCNFGYRDSIFKKELKGKVIITSVSLRLKKNATLNVEYSSLRQKLSERSIEIPTIKDVSNAVIEIRQSKLPDPKEIGNTGSFFKNPVISVYQFDELKKRYPSLTSYPVSERQVKVPAGWLIEQAGWKGKRLGDAGVHDKQALVLVNHANASGEEIWALAQKIISSVKEKFEINLTPEVNIIKEVH